MLLLPQRGALTLLVFIIFFSFSSNATAFSWRSFFRITGKNDKSLDDNSIKSNSDYLASNGNVVSAEGVARALRNENDLSPSTFDVSTIIGEKPLPDDIAVNFHDDTSSRLSASTYRERRRTSGPSSLSAAKSKGHRTSAGTFSSLMSAATAVSGGVPIENGDDEPSTSQDASSPVSSRRRNGKMPGEMSSNVRRFRRKDSHRRNGLRSKDRVTSGAISIDSKGPSTNDKHFSSSPFSGIKSTQQDTNDKHDKADVYNNKNVGLPREIEEITRKLGPLPVDVDMRSSDDGIEQEEDLHDIGIGQVNGETHPILTRRIEDVITGLMSVYKALRSSTGASSGMGHGMSGTSHTNTPANRHSSHSSDNSVSVDSTDAERTSRKSAHDPASAVPRFSEMDGNKTNDAVERNAVSTDGVAKKEGHDSGGDIANSVEDGGMGAETSVTALVVLAGIVFVAAVGVMGMGYFHNRNDGAGQTQPLYPPHGPAFV